MKRTASLHGRHIPLHNPVVGAWCPSCLLPSGVTVLVLITERDEWRIADYAWCLDCGAEL